MRYAVFLLAGALCAAGCAARKPALTEGTTEVRAAHPEGAGVDRNGEGETPAAGGGPATSSDVTAAPGGPESIGPESMGPVHKGPVSEEPRFSENEIEQHTESILNVISTLEECYATGDFEKWKSLLTERYRESHEDPDFLRAEGWDANDLHSFFRLLVKTRKQGNVSSLSVSRVEFANRNKALVYVFLGGEEFPEPQHTFIRVEDRWYKGLQEEGE